MAAVVPAERLADETADAGQRLASGPTRRIGLTKRLVNAAEDATLAESLAAEAALQDLAGRTRRTTPRAWPPSPRSASREFRGR